MTAVPASSPRARIAASLVCELQDFFVDGLQAISGETMSRHEWLRDGGRHGGGHRYACADSPFFNRAAVNVSGVHYDDDPDKRLRSADALSTIIHPRHPLAPSVHLHVSWTEMRDGQGYYRMMADLNPSIDALADTESFRQALRRAAPEHFEEATQQGDRYFYIPALKRHRGSCHFYLEGFRGQDFESDTEMARRVGKAAMTRYLELLGETAKGAPPPTSEQEAAQLAYHTVYLFQVLTLDRGTTSGLMVHDQNDLGIMGSIPSFVDRELLRSWQKLVPAPQDKLVASLVEALPEGAPCPVDDAARLALAAAVRKHYRQYPEALAMQARGDIVPPTVENHR